MTSSRGEHKRARIRQMRMDIEGTFSIPINVPPERIKDGIITLFDSDFAPSIKAIKDWIIESNNTLESYFNRSSKQDEIKKLKLGFIDGIGYFCDILLKELAYDSGKSLEDIILEDLAPLVAEPEPEPEPKYEGLTKEVIT